MNSIKSTSLVLLCLFLISACLSSQIRETKKPFADVHLHFNWDHKELISADDAVKTLRKNNVKLAVVFSVPSKTAEELAQAAPDIVIPFYSPYINVRSRHTWYTDKSVLVEVRNALKSGRYKGIGETHLVAGIGPRRTNEIFIGLMALAMEFDVPMVLHTESSDYRYFLPICKKFSKVRIQWAHAGGILYPEQVAKLLEACPNVWAELSARDPWHYGGLVDEAGNLSEEWRTLLLRFQDRFMVGTDPVWNAHQIDRWYEADKGWEYYSRFHLFHRRWLQMLPADVEEKIRWKNAQRFYRLKKQ